MLGGVVVERQQLLEVVGDLRGGLGELRAVGGVECLRRGAGVLLVLGVPDLAQGLLRPGMGTLGQRTEYVCDLVEPAALLTGVAEHLAERPPEPERTITDGQDRSPHAAPGAVAQQVRPGLGRLPVPVGQDHEFLAPISTDADHDQQAELVFLQTDVDVDPVGPQVDVVHFG